MMMGMIHHSFLFQRKARSSLKIENLEAKFFNTPISATLFLFSHHEIFQDQDIDAASAEGVEGIGGGVDNRLSSQIERCV